MCRDFVNVREGFTSNFNEKEYEALSKNEDILYTILDSINDGILAVDNNRNIIHTNKRFKEMWKIPDELFDDNNSDHLLDFVIDQLIDTEDFYIRINELYKSSEESQDTIKFKDGRIFDRFTRPLSIDNTIKGRVWIFKDITHLKKNEKELKDKIAFQHKFINTLPNPAFIKNKESIYIDCNTAYEKFLGKTKDQILGKDLYEVFPTKLAKKYHEMDQKLLKSKDTQTYEYPMIHADNTMHDVFINKAVFTDAENSIAGLVGVIYDITERKRMEKALYESEERYRNLFESFPLSIIIHDGYRVILANKTSANLVGFSKPDELIGKKIMELVHSDYHEIVKKRITQVQKQKKNLPKAEIKFVKIDGTIIDVEITSTYFLYNDRIVSQVVIKNITLHKKEKALREQTESKLNEAIEYNKLITEFFANISHEFKTPLNILLGTFQLLLINLDNEREKQQWKNSYRKIKIMQQNCYRLLRLVNNLIDITKIDSGHFKLNSNYYNIISLIENVTLSVAKHIQSKDIKLIFDTNVEEEIMYFDPDAIERIVLNLLSNAVKFTESGGDIQVTVESKEKILYISVKDNGIGIPEDKKDIIFDRFRQVDKLLTRKQEGSGIGLSLIKSLVEMHNGKIYISDNQEIGTEFILEFPINISRDKSRYNVKEIVFPNECADRINIEFSDIYC